MTAPAVVRDLVGTEGLTEPSATDSLARISVWVLTYAAAATAAVRIGGPVVVVAGTVSCGLLLAGNLAAMHEAAHRNLFHHRLANRLAGYLFAVPILMPFGEWRSWHLRHHAATHAPGDPEPLTVLTATWQYAVGVPLTFAYIIGEMWVAALRVVVGQPPAWARRIHRSRAAADLLLVLAMVAGLAVLASRHPRWFVLGWLVPWVLGQFVFAPLFQSSEHYACIWGPADPLETSRSTTTNALVRFIVWNGNYHAAHHLAAGVPGRNLPRLHAAVAPECRFVERSYLRWHLALIGQLLHGEHAEPLPDRFTETSP